MNVTDQKKVTVRVDCARVQEKAPARKEQQSFVDLALDDRYAFD